MRIIDKKIYLKLKDLFFVSKLLASTSTIEQIILKFFDLYILPRRSQPKVCLAWFFYPIPPSHPPFLPTWKEESLRQMFWTAEEEKSIRVFLPSDAKTGRPGDRKKREILIPPNGRCKKTLYMKTQKECLVIFNTN